MGTKHTDIGRFFNTEGIELIRKYGKGLKPLFEIHKKLEALVDANYEHIEKTNYDNCEDIKLLLSAPDKFKAEFSNLVEQYKLQKSKFKPQTKKQK